MGKSKKVRSIKRSKKKILERRRAKAKKSRESLPWSKKGDEKAIKRTVTRKAKKILSYHELHGSVLREKDSTNNQTNESMPGASSSNGQYRIYKDGIWIKLLSGLKCKTCSKSSLTVKHCNERGFECNVQVICSDCETVHSECRSSSLNSNEGSIEINELLTNAFLDMGVGFAGMEKLGTEMNIKIMCPKTFLKYVNLAYEKNEVLREAILSRTREVVRRAHINENPELADKEIINIAVSFDGSWHTRGFLSLHGLGIVIDILTGLVIDFVILSKYCELCMKMKKKLKTKAKYSDWQKEHKEKGECEQNFNGSSGAMELHAAEILWKNSIRKCRMRYVIFLGDGDAKSFTHLKSLNIYEGIQIEKQECINHVSKRIYSALKTIAKTLSSQNESIGGGKFGSLSEVKMKTLQSYYGKAIRTNAPDVKAMQTAIFSTIYHASSTDEKPRHHYCPEGVDSWCFWQKAKAQKKLPKNHSKMSLHLRPDVVEQILPVYERLTQDDLLKRCTTIGTQNANESVHNSIWAKCPKTKSTSLKKLEIAATNGIGEFNMGYETMLKMKQTSKGCTDVQSAASSIAAKRDVKRCQSSIARSKDSSRYKRKAQKRSKSNTEKAQKEKEGPTYGPGIAE